MQVRYSSRATIQCSVLAALAAIPAVAKNNAKAPSPPPVPYTASSTPGVSVRSVPSAAHAGGAVQVYIMPGGEFPVVASARPASTDKRYTTPVPGPKGTLILFVDPALAIQETVRVAPGGKVVMSCGDTKDVKKSAKAPARKAAGVKSRGGSR